MSSSFSSFPFNLRNIQKLPKFIIAKILTKLDVKTLIIFFDNSNQKLRKVCRTYPELSYIVNSNLEIKKEKNLGKKELEYRFLKSIYEKDLIKAKIYLLNGVNIDHYSLLLACGGEIYMCNYLFTKFQRNKGDLQVVKFVINEMNERNIPISDFGLIAGCENDNIEIVEYFLDECHINIAGKNSLLTYVKSLNMANCLLNRGMDVNYPLGEPIDHAIHFGDMDLIKLFVRKGAIINPTDDDSYVPLLGAIENDNLPVVRYLVEECGADVNIRNNFPSRMARSWASEDVINYLRDRGAR